MSSLFLKKNYLYGGYVRRDINWKR